MAKVDWCHRQSYYRLAGTTPTDDGERFSFQMENIFAEGHEIHRKWQQWLSDMGRLWGVYACRVCGWEETGTYQMGGRCPSSELCEGRLEYREVPLTAEDTLLIAGHEDGADVETNALIEIKSIGMGTLRMEEPELLRKYQVETIEGKKIYDLESLWKGLKYPLLSHRKQTGIYLALAKRMKLPFDKVTFLYEYKATQSVKAFTVAYNEELVRPLLDKALAVKYSLAEKKPPPRPDHTGKETKVCKTCPFRTLCYSDDSGGSAEEVVPDDQGPVPAKGRSRRSGRAGRTRGLPPTEAGEGSPTAAGRRYRTKRQRPDVAVQSGDPVGGVPGGSTGRRNGVREVRRRVPR